MGQSRTTKHTEWHCFPLLFFCNSEQSGWTESEPGREGDRDCSDNPFERLLFRGVYAVSWGETRHGGMFHLFRFPRCERWVPGAQNELHPETEVSSFDC